MSDEQRDPVLPRHVFLAPHCDDVALSCGGLVAGLVAAGERVAVVTIFGGAPAPGTTVTPWARWLIEQWGVPSLDAGLRMRRAEDEAATTLLGASLQTLSFVDGAFRGDRYPSWEAMQGAVVPADAALPEAIAAAIQSLGVIGPGTTVTGPLAVGNHVDHQITLAAMRLLVPSVARVRGYEDFPYAAKRDGAVSARLVALVLPDATPETVNIAPWLGTKIRAIAAYTSQQRELFDDAPMPDFVRKYAAAVADGRGYAERYWSF